MSILSIKRLVRTCVQRPDRPVYEGSRAELLDHLKGEALLHKSLYHYTQWENFVKMMTPVSLGRDGEHRVMLLSQATKMNDKTEKGWGKRVYFTCFSYSKYEDVAMWMNYGKRSPNAVRVRFGGKDVKAWFEAHREAKDCVYGAKKRGEEYEFKKIPPAEIESVEYADVAYVIHNKLMSPKHCGNVEYGRDFFVIRGEDDSFTWSDDVYEGDPRRTVGDLPAFFKKRGWGYERETRLVITLKPEAGKYERIAVVFDDVFSQFENLSKDDLAPLDRDGWTCCDDLCKKPSRNMLMQGPWYNEKFASSAVVGACGIGFSDVKSKSDYRSEIDIISNVRKEPMQQYVEAEAFARSLTGIGSRKVTADDESFLRPLSVDLRSAAMTINRHIDKSSHGGDPKPNKYKLERLSVLDINRLAALALYWDVARDLYERFHEIAVSSENHWKDRIGMVKRYR